MPACAHVQLVPLGVCAIWQRVRPHTRAHIEAGNGPQHGTADILNQLSGCKKTTATGNAKRRDWKGRGLGKRRGRQSAVRVDAKVNKNVNTPNVMLTRQTERKQSELELQTQCTVTEEGWEQRGDHVGLVLAQVIGAYVCSPGFAIKLTAIFIVNLKIVYDNRTM